MYRITLRFSLDGDTGSKIRNKIAPKLKNAGFKNVKTGTWEVYSTDSAGVHSGLSDVFRIVAKSKKLDHFWFHAEKFSRRQYTVLLKAAKRINPR